VLNFAWQNRMDKLSNKDIFSEILEGNEDILIYLHEHYFQQCRRWLRRKGFPDQHTPQLFAEVLVKLFREIQRKKIPGEVEFEPYFFNLLDEHVSEEKRSRKEQANRVSPGFTDAEKNIISSCTMILDEHVRKLLFARYVEYLSFEEIAARFNYEDPVVAQKEVEHAMLQLENISKIRLEISIN